MSFSRMLRYAKRQRKQMNVAADDGASSRNTSHEVGSDTLVSAIVCTRNRGDRIVPTITSILANTGCELELVIIDQSSDERCAQAVAPYVRDARVRYVRSSEVGLGNARNAGLRLARAEAVAFTDDDVVVPPTWLAATQRIFRERPRVAVAFFNVTAAEHDRSKGFIPAYERQGSIEVTTVAGKCAARGIGAGLCVRRSAVLQLGGFDGMLGAGGVFSSCEDGDVALRALLAGWHIFETDEVTVVHDGFRTWEEGKELTKRDWYGIGAAYAKPIKAGRLGAAVVVLYEGVGRAMLSPWAPLLKLKPPHGLKRGAYFWWGFVAGLRTPVEKGTILFRGQ
jgi:glycosyltransferase involved in cell wall biosynthesis